MNLKPTRYTVKKNDNLDRIARSHGYSSWKILYYSGFNAELRARCPNPDKITEGVTVFLPPHAPDVVSALRRSNRLLIAAKQDLISATDNEIQNVRRSLKQVETVGRNADIAASALLLINSIAGIVGSGAEAMKLSGAALKAKNLEIAKETITMSYEPIVEKGLEFYSEADLDKNIVTVTSQIIVTSYLQMMSPSFWASTVSNLQGGMSWSQAVTTKPQDVFDKCVNEILNQREKLGRDLDRRINENNKLIMEFSKPVDRPLPVKIP